MVFDAKKMMCGVVMLLLFVCNSVSYSQQVSRTVNYEATLQPFGEGIHKEYPLPAEIKNPDNYFQLVFNVDLTPEDITAEIIGTITFDQGNRTLQMRGTDGKLQSEGGISFGGIIKIGIKLPWIPGLTRGPILIKTEMPFSITNLISKVGSIALPISINALEPWNELASFNTFHLNGKPIEIRGGIRDLIRLELTAVDILSLILTALTSGALPPPVTKVLGIVFDKGIGNAGISYNLGFLSTATLTGKSITVNGQQITNESQIIEAIGLDLSQNSYTVNSSYQEQFTYQLDYVVSSDVLLKFNPLGFRVWDYEKVILEIPTPIIPKQEVDLNFTSAQTTFPIAQAEVSKPPVAVNTILTQDLTVSGRARRVDVARYFSSSNALIYDAESNPRGIVTERVEGSEVTITPRREGSASVVVTARDREDRSLFAIQTIPVTVRSNRPNNVDQPSDPNFIPTTANPVVENLGNRVEIIVQNTGRLGLNIRSNPWVSNINPNNRIGKVYDGATGRITDGPKRNGGFIWWKIDWDLENKEGWCVEAFGGSQLLFPRPPDLEIRSFNVSDDEVEPGEAFTINATVRNNGPGESPATEIFFYYQKSDEDTPRVAGDGKRNVRALRARSSQRISLRVTAPMTPGDYEYGAILPPDIPDSYDEDLVKLVDPTKRIRLNNLDTEDVEVTSSPDLIVESISADKSTVDPGEAFRLSATVRNQGIGEPSRNATLRYYRSRDARISKSDIDVGDDSIRSSDLDTNDPVERSERITAPIEPGVYYYGAYVDLRFESNTRNNASSAVAITVRDAGPPDLVVSTPTLSANSLPPGQSLTVTTTVRNQGTGPASATTLRVHRSDNANISDVDTEVGAAEVRLLSPNNTQTVRINLTTPVAAGTYYYGVCVDDVSSESDTVNNCSTGVTLTVENLAPVAADTLTAQTLVAGTASVVDVAPYFSDPNEDPLTYQPTSSSIEIVTVEMSGLSDSHLRMNPLAAGTATVTVEATDRSGLAFSQTFSVTVNLPPNRAPVAIGTIAPETLIARDASKTVDVSGLFHDLDGDTLRYTASSDNTRVLSTNVSDEEITLIPLTEGSVSVTVTASDGELTATLSIAVSVTPYMGAETWMPDESLREAVRTALGLASDDALTQQAMEGLIILNAASSTAGTGVQNLTGLEHATQLTILNLGRTGVRDLTPLQELTQLTQLNLIYTEISDLTPLQGLTNLTSLNLERVGIRDLTPLQGLTALTSLSLGHTSISDIAPLKGLAALTYLDLKNNQISDIAPVTGLTQLVQLYLDGNQISDVSPLEGLTALQLLTLEHNPITDMAPLQRLKENNPNLSIDVDIEPQAPDLRVDAVRVNKTTVAPGETFRLDAVIMNGGEADASEITVQYYQSTDATISETDTQLKTGTLGLIAVDAMKEPWTQLTAPDTPGVYYYGVCVDEVAGESDTDNNCSTGVVVTVLGADLRVNSVRVNKTTAPPGEKSRLTAETKDRGEAGSLETPDRSAVSTIAPGDQFRLDVSIENRGKADSTQTTLRYYLSSDETISSEDMEVHTATLPSIAADAMREPSAQLTAPDTPGVYYYGVCVDEVAGESDTDNNCSTAVAVTVERAGSVDFVVESVRASKTTVKPGENFQISAVIHNQGEIDATATVLRYYLSTDEDISTADTEVHTATLPVITADATHQQSRQFTAPNTPDTYYYGVCIDAITGESDTANNCSIAVAVTVGGADLMIDGTPQVSKTTVSPGETFQMDTRVWNQGNAPSDATTLRYYLSTDDIISAEDTEVTNDNVAALSGKGAHASRRRAELSKILTAPDTPGDYYYGVCVDSVAGDANIVNNCSQAIAITVEAPLPDPVAPGDTPAPNLGEIEGPDLIISAVRVDASTIKIGGGVRFHITLTNQGTSLAPATIIRYYRSSDATITTEDTELRAVPVGQLGSGKSYTTWALLPSAFSVGTYYYGACLDGVAAEFNTSNNCSDAVEIIMVLQSDPVEGLGPRGRMPTQTLKAGDSPESLSVSRYFAGKVDTWEVSSSKPAVAVVSMEADSDVVTLTPVSQGHSVVTVTARHGDLAAEQTFDVYVGIDPALVLRWKTPVPPQPLSVGGSPLVLDLSGNVENEVERWRAVSSHPGIVVVSMSGSSVTLTPVSEGNAEVTIYASGGTTEVEHTFRVFVGAAGEPDLKWVLPVPPQTLVVGGSPVTLDVSGHVAGEVETWQASSSNEALVTVSMSGSIVTLTPVSEGSSNVTISARRGDLEVNGTFTVSVGADDSLEWGVPIPTQTLEEGGSAVNLDVSGYVVGEVETWEASSSNVAFVTVSMSGAVVTLTPVSVGSSDVTIRARRGDLTAESTFTVSVGPDSSPEVSIPDANLSALVRDTLGLAEGDTLTQRKMGRLTTLSASDSQIEDLTGLEHATRLTVLSLTGENRFGNITPFAKLTALTNLHFSVSQVSDISPLKGLTALTRLDIRGSPISDLSPLKGLTALTSLYFEGTNISDLSPLEKLTALTSLTISTCPLSDLSPLEKLTALTRLSLGQNAISDLSPLEKLTALTNLTLWRNRISDLSPLEKLTALTNLNLRQNQITDVSPLEKLTALTVLSLQQNQITDVSPLEDLTSLTHLFLDGNAIADLAPLRRLKENNSSVFIDIDINAGVQEAPSAQVLPDETALLSNYPNPFNPETWIPYQLASPADVTLTIYDVRGVVVRRLALGHRPAGFYYSRGRAAHWDGRNQLGEKVASGLYFYTFTAGEFTATRRMFILK